MQDYIVASGGKLKHTTAYVWKATWSLILIMFFEEDKEQGYDIVNEILVDAKIPPKTRKELVKRWIFMQDKQRVTKSLREIDRTYRGNL